MKCSDELKDRINKGLPEGVEPLKKKQISGLAEVLGKDPVANNLFSTLAGFARQSQNLASKEEMDAATRRGAAATRPDGV